MVKEVAPLSSKEKVAKIIAIICFALVMLALATAIISDIIILSMQIIGFILAIYMAAIVFIVGLMLMIISFIFIFGVYIIDSYGFWPITWASSTFNEIMEGNKITAEQLNQILIIRIVLLAVCVIVFASSIAAIVISKKAKKQNKERKQKLTKAFSIVSLILSILGIVVVSGAIVILSLI